MGLELLRLALATAKAEALFAGLGGPRNEVVADIRRVGKKWYVWALTDPE